MIDIATFLCPFFEKVRDADYLWAIAHGWEGLPTYVRHDIDVFVEPRGVDCFFETIRKTCVETGWHFFLRRTKVIYSACLIVKFEGDGNFRFIQFDVFSGSITKGITSVPGPIEELPNRWLNENGIWCMEYGYVGANVFLKESIHNGCIRGAQRQNQIRNGVMKSEDEFRRRLVNYIGNLERVQQLIAAIKNDDWAMVDMIAKSVEGKRPVFHIRHIWNFICWAVRTVEIRFRPFFKVYIVIACSKNLRCRDAVVEILKDSLLLNPFSDAFILGDYKNTSTKMPNDDVGNSVFDVFYALKERWAIFKKYPYFSIVISVHCHSPSRDSSSNRHGGFVGRLAEVAARRPDILFQIATDGELRIPRAYVVNANQDDKGIVCDIMKGIGRWLLTKVECRH